MEWIVAVGHLLGAVIATMVLSFAVMMVAAWEGKRNQRLAVEEASLALGVSVESLDSPEMIPRVTQWSAERFSNEHLRNRLSDFCGYIRTAWDWLGTILQAAVLLGVAWYTFTDDRSIAVYAWSIVPLALFFWLAGVVFALACRLLTGRYPGQARLGRKALAEFIKNRDDSTSVS